MYTFFARHLKLDGNAWKTADGTRMDESGVAMETHQALQVFTDRHPLPAHALKPDSKVLLPR